MGTYDLTLKRGITETLVVTYKDGDGVPINLTGYVVRSQGRASMEDASPIFSRTIGNGVTVNAAMGEITITWPAAQTINYQPTINGVWSLEIENASGVVTELTSGELNILERPTRE